MLIPETEIVVHFWAQFDAAAPEREMEAKIQSALVKFRLLRGWKESRLEKRGDGTYHLDLSKLPVSDVAALRELPISDLDISNTRVAKLAPIAKCPLRVLIAYFFFECDTLEELLLPPKAKDIAPLRLLPNMRTISFRRDAGGFKPAQTPEEFWAEVDENTKK